MKMTEVEDRKYLHIEIFGPPKSGKTRLVGQLAEHDFTLHLFDYESGSKTLFTSLPKEFRKNVNIYRVQDTKDTPLGIETALKVTKLGSHELCDLHGKVTSLVSGKMIKCPLCSKVPTATYSTFDNTKLGPKDIVIHDSLTQLTNSALAHVGLGKDDTWKPERDDWAKQGNILDRLLSNVQNAPYHIICITHENPIEMNDGKEKMVPLAGTRNFSRTGAKYFDEVIYTNVFNKRHIAASSSTYANNILTGSRSNVTLENEKEEAKLSLLPIFENQELILTHKDETKAILQSIDLTKKA